jgi:hypothetical protein
MVKRFFVAFDLIRATNSIIPQIWYYCNLPTVLIMLYNVLRYSIRYSKEDSMRRAFGFLIGTVIGGFIGAGAALLFTPLSGKDLRYQINDRLQGVATSIRSAANTKRIELQERLDSLRAPR